MSLKQQFSYLCRLHIAILVLLLTTNHNVMASEADQKVYTVGVVPQFETRRLHEIWRPILNKIEEKTGYQFKIEGSPTIPDFEQEFMSGKFDFSYMNPYHIIIANEKIGYIPLVKDVGRTLHGVLTVRKNSNVESPYDLDGKTIAFPAPNALGASLQMRQELSDKFNIKFNPRYVKTHDSVYLNVALRQTDAGGGVQKTLNRQKDAIKNNLKIIHKTTPVSPHPLAVHPRVSEEVRAKVKAAFLALGENNQGRSLLAQIPMKKIGEANMSDYEPLLKMGLQRFYKTP